MRYGGKAGGVKVVKSIDDVKKEATRLLGSTLITHQTGPKGKQVNRLYVEEVCRRLAVELDDVHGCHGQPGAVDHATDRAVERNVIEVEL